MHHYYLSQGPHFVSWQESGAEKNYWPTESLTRYLLGGVIRKLLPAPAYPKEKVTMAGPPLFNAWIQNRRELFKTKSLPELGIVPGP